jgi:hypothetical protein
MSTPRTDEEEMRQTQRFGGYMVKADFARQLERELSATMARIQKLEEAGDAMLNAWLMPEDSMEYSEWVALSADAKSKWYAAKETKP